MTRDTAEHYQHFINGRGVGGKSAEDAQNGSKGSQLEGPREDFKTTKWLDFWNCLASSQSKSLPDEIGTSYNVFV